MIQEIDRQYEDLLEDILKNGKEKEDRTGTGTISKFGAQVRFDLNKGFPLITTKKVFMRGISEELFWFLNGDTNVKTLQNKNVHIWDQWRKPYNSHKEIVLIDKKHVEETNEEPQWTKEEFLELTNENGKIYQNLNNEDKLLFNEWFHMINKCYYSHQEGYAEPENNVDPQWFNYQNFLKDAKHLPHYWYWYEDNFGTVKNKMYLDVDYYEANYYSAETCIWQNSKDALLYVNDYVIKVSDTIGNSKIFINEENAKSFLNVDNFEKVDKNEKIIEKVYPSKNKLYRLELIEDGDLGNVYGSQWRKWKTSDSHFIDQISELIENLKNNPDSRRHIISGWNVGEIDNMALPPCHTLFQFYVIDGKLSCQLYQRSADYFLGVCYNWASYSLLTHMIAQQVGLEVGDFIWTAGDVHIYKNHTEQVKEQLNREPYPFPSLKLHKAKDIFSYTWDDVEIVDYQCHPVIKAPIAV